MPVSYLKNCRSNDSEILTSVPRIIAIATHSSAFSHPFGGNRNQFLTAVKKLPDDKNSIVEVVWWYMAAQTTTMEKFRALGLSENVLGALEKKGWESPSPIQEKTIPLLLADEKDIVGQAQTGTGKTGAFGLPLIEKLDDTSRKVQALILCPTRELAMQVAEEIASFKGSKRIWVQAVYGGASFSMQQRALQKGVQIVVGTPGRVRDHIERGTLKLDGVTHIVLDEADEMLNMGFEEEVREILKSVPEQRRMLLFSATMPPQILKLAKTFMGAYDLVEVKKEQLTIELTDQMYFEVRDSDRFEALCRIIDTEPEFYGIVFCRTKMETDDVASKLIDRGYDAEAIHGDVTQFQREQTLKKFKLRKLTILVATDVAARGIDVNDLTHVVNYNLPQDPEAYVHRIGRTGRAGKHGTAISIISPSEYRSLLFIQKVARAQIKKEEVPSVADVVATKLMKLKTEVAGIIEKGEASKYADLAQELLEEGKAPAEVVSALLIYSMKDSLQESSYREIGSVKGRQQGGASAGGGDKARLFVAKGHMDHMNADKVAQFLAEEAGVSADVIHDVRVFDKFSFVSVPFAEAEQILVVFEKKAGGRRSLVTRAKDKDSGGGGGRGFGGGGGKKWDDRKPKFDGERKKFGDREGKGSGERKSYGEKKSFGERKSYGDKKEFGEKKQYGEKREFKKREVSNQGEAQSAGENKPRPEGEFKPKKRENKLTDYLEGKKPAEKPQQQPNKKKKDTTDLDEFMKKFDDDLSW